uniref:Uncharacterized protein n=1 Tax=Anguilla anguilla TaxID=7936 RepID=A0A0E9T5W7_ANGAN
MRGFTIKGSQISKGYPKGVPSLYPGVQF